MIPSPGRPRDLLREPCEKVLDTAVRPLEENLGDQVVRRGISLGTNEPVRLFLLGPTIDVQSTKGDSKTLRELPSLPDREWHAMGAPLGQNDGEPLRASEKTSGEHATH